MGGSRIVAFSGAFYWIAAFAVVATVVNRAGIVAIFRYREQAERSLPYFMCFAAGVLISTPLVLALPNAVGKNPDAGFFALGGFLFMFFSNKVIKYYTKEETLAFGVTAAEGIGIHSLVDGVVYEFAEGVIAYLVLLEGDVPERKAAASAFVIAALTTPVGAFAAYPVVSRFGPSHLGLVLGFVSGVLLYVSAAHLLPEAQKHEKAHSTVAFVAGVAMALFIVFSRTA